MKEEHYCYKPFKLLEPSVNESLPYDEEPEEDPKLPKRQTTTMSLVSEFESLKRIET
jgi:hypothetical protein